MKQSFSSALCFALLVATVALRAAGQDSATIRVGSKSFTESVILGEMLRALAQHAGANAEHRAELGGTQIVWQALQAGEIDAYVEYTGTLAKEILQADRVRTIDDIRKLIESKNVRMSESLGFNNTYALGMKKPRAKELGITKISDLRGLKEFTFGFSNEFVDRDDGWPGLKSTYELPDFKVHSLDHSLAYRGLENRAIDAIDIYSTDSEIITYDLQVLEDDRGYFPLYYAVILYRADLERSAPKVVEQFRRLQGKINNAAMAELNARSASDKVAEASIAATFLNATIDSTIPVPREESLFEQRFQLFIKTTLEHILLVSISLTCAICAAIPLGIVAYKKPKAGNIILGTVGVIQTIPSMALLVFMIPIPGLGLGAAPAIVALFLYSLLPIVRGTYTGLQGLPNSIHESALALGIPDGARLKLIELPLASQSILAGIKTSAVINVGTATIGALISAGGYGQPILTGIRLFDISLILQGAIPAALLALVVQALFGLVERRCVPLGLRLART